MLGSIAKLSTGVFERWMVTESGYAAYYMGCHKQTTSDIVCIFFLIGDKDVNQARTSYVSAGWFC